MMINKEMIEEGLICFDDIVDNMEDCESMEDYGGDLEALLDNL